jgi:hypothetical protein
LENKQQSEPTYAFISIKTPSKPTTTPSNIGNTNSINNQQPHEPVLDFNSLNLDDLMNSIKVVNHFRHSEDDESINLCGKFNKFDCSTPIPPKPPPGSLLSDIARPPLPTNICDFPYFELEPPNADYKLQLRSTTILPQFSVGRAELDRLKCSVSQTKEELKDWDDDKCRVSEVTTYSVVADIGAYGRAFVVQLAKADRGDLADLGANCCMTANINLLTNIHPLKNPITIGLAVSNDGIISSTSELRNAPT